MKLEDLKPNKANPRKITTAQLKRLKKSLAKFGDLGCIIENEVTGNMVGGHQRREALETGDIIIEHTFDTPTKTGTVAEGFVVCDGERFKYRRVRWDVTAERAACIAANKHGGEWYIPSLVDQLIELDAAGVPLEITGFDESELKSLLTPDLGKNKEPKDKSGNGATKKIECPECGHSFEVDDKE